MKAKKKRHYIRYLLVDDKGVVRDEARTFGEAFERAKNPAVYDPDGYVVGKTGVPLHIVPITGTYTPATRKKKGSKP